jgi:hypothetical protein
MAIARLTGPPTIMIVGPDGSEISVGAITDMSAESEILGDPDVAPWVGHTFTMSAKLDPGAFDGLRNLAILRGMIEDRSFVIEVDSGSVSGTILDMAMDTREPIGGDISDAVGSGGLFVVGREDRGEDRVAYTLSTRPVE